MGSSDFVERVVKEANEQFDRCLGKSIEYANTADVPILFYNKVFTVRMNMLLRYDFVSRGSNSNFSGLPNF